MNNINIIYYEKILQKYGKNYTTKDVFDDFIERISNMSTRLLSESEKKEIFEAIKDVFDDITQRKLK